SAEQHLHPHADPPLTKVFHGAPARPTGCSPAALRSGTGIAIGAKMPIYRPSWPSRLRQRAFRYAAPDHLQARPRRNGTSDAGLWPALPELRARRAGWRYEQGRGSGPGRQSRPGVLPHRTARTKVSPSRRHAARDVTGPCPHPTSSAAGISLSSWRWGSRWPLRGSDPNGRASAGMSRFKLEYRRDHRLAFAMHQAARNSNPQHEFGMKMKAIRSSKMTYQGDPNRPIERMPSSDHSAAWGGIAALLAVLVLIAAGAFLVLGPRDGARTTAENSPVTAPTQRRVPTAPPSPPKAPAQ